MSIVQGLPNMTALDPAFIGALTPLTPAWRRGQ